MRDLLIAFLLVGTVLWALREPWIGAMGWTITSLMSPHMAFGYAAADWPVGAAFAGATLLGLLFTKDRQNPLIGGAATLTFLLTVWITATLPFSLYFDNSFPLWDRSIKIFLMLFVTMTLLTNRAKLDVFIWINVIAIGYFGVKGGLFTILTGGSYRVWGPGGFIGGNNELGLAVVTIIPLMRYLQQRMTHRWSRVALTISMGLCVVMALGTHSRGALLGASAMVALFWWRNDRKALWGSMILVGGILALSMMPAQWWDRMQTIETYDQDASALGRINAWHTAFNLANDRLIGGGFWMWTTPVFQIYAPDPKAVYAAHSIYFQALGEQGWIGLALYLGIGAATWKTCRDLNQMSRQSPDLKWAGDLGSMVQVSMVGFAVAGAFLSLTWFDLPYNLMAMVVLARKFARAELAGLMAAAPAGAGGAPVESSVGAGAR